METPSQTLISKYLLIAFLIASFVLISLIWAQAVSGENAQSPGFYRNTAPANEAFYLTRTAEFSNYTLGTPTPKREHKHGENEHSENASLTPTATIDWDAREDDQ